MGCPSKMKDYATIYQNYSGLWHIWMVNKSWYHKMIQISLKNEGDLEKTMYQKKTKSEIDKKGWVLERVSK